MITQTKTAVDLNNFYKFLNSDPLTFNGMYLSCIDTGDSLCGDGDIWSHYNMPLSREKLSQLVLTAELEVEEFLGTPVKARWIKEEIEIPTTWFNNNLSIPITEMTFKTSKRFIKRFGQQRLEKIISNVEITYIDLDEDGFNESAEITFELPENEELCDVRLYFLDTEYELRGFTIKSYDEDSRDVVITIDSWLLIKPNLYLKRDFLRNSPALDGCNQENYVEFLDVWVDAVDTCKPSIEFVFNESHNCNGSCVDSKQPGCARIINSCEGTFKVNTQAYDENDCVTDGSFSICGRPKKIIVYYQAGCFSTDCQDEYSICKVIEDIVFKITAARYPYPTCDCKCIQSVLKTMAQQTSFIIKNEGIIYRYNSKVMENAVFGTAVGEIEASMQLYRIMESFCNY